MAFSREKLQNLLAEFNGLFRAAKENTDKNFPDSAYYLVSRQRADELLRQLAAALSAAPRKPKRRAAASRYLKGQRMLPLDT